MSSVPRLVAPRSLVVLRRGTLSCRTLSSLATLYWAHARVHLSAIALPCVFCGFVAPFLLHSAEGKFGSAEVRPKHFGLLDPLRHTLSSPARWATLRRDVWGCLRLLLRQSVEVGARERRGRRGEGAAIPDGAAAVVFSSEARTNGSSNTSFICYRCSSADCVRSSRGKRVIGVQPESDRR